MGMNFQGVFKMQHKIAWLLLFSIFSLCLVSWQIYAGGIFAFLFIILILFQLNKDIVLRKKVEESLIQKEFKYRNLVENAGAVIYSTDLNGNINFASSKATELTGYSLEELEDSHFSSLVDPSGLAKVTENYINQVRSGIEETTMTFLITTKAGKKKWVEQSAVLLLENNQPVGFQCIIKDISEKRQMQLELENFEFKLKENQILLQSILDHTTSLIYIKDLSGKYILVNKRFKEMLNMEEGEIINKTDYDFVPAELADHYKSLDDEVIRTGKSIETEELIHTEKGDINLLLIKFPLLDIDNKVWGLSGMANDITERVHYQQQLIKATKDAEEAKLLQEQFLANMSHEIRTPMNGIQGMTNLLLDTTLTEQQKEFASIIKHSTQNLLVIINDILDFSKIKAGKLTIEKIDFALADVVNNVRALFEHRIKKKGLQLLVEIDRDIPVGLKGDAHRLNQLFINLIGNAIKFTEFGHIRLHITLQSRKGDKAILLFAISDTGIGIPAKSLDHIFESFSQAGVDTSRLYGGTGLGLAICKNLLQLLGGDISVTSTEGKGSTFNFHIPFEYVDKQEAAELILPNIYDYNKLLVGKRFLVAEDNEVNQKIVNQVLKKAGGIVQLVNDGKQAIEQLRDKKYDLIIMDLQMPVMDGYAAARYIRSTLLIETPILAMTANVLKGELLRCLQAGMNDYMSKPFEFTELYKRITCLLNNQPLSSIPAAGISVNRTTPYDLSLLEEVGDSEYFLDVLNTFLANMPLQFKELQFASTQQDFEKVFFLAHKLKGSTSMLQAPALTGILGKIEQFSKEKADTTELIQKAWVLYSEIEVHLQSEKKRAETITKPTIK